MILEEKHQKRAIEIVQSNRTKKSCNKCYDRGYVGFTPDKTVVPCEKCVDLDKAYNAWKDYVAQNEDLKEQFPEVLEEAPNEADETEETEVSASDVKATKNKDDFKAQKPSAPPPTQTKTAKTSAVRKTSGRGK